MMFWNNLYLCESNEKMLHKLIDNMFKDLNIVAQKQSQEG